MIRAILTALLMLLALSATTSAVAQKKDGAAKFPALGKGLVIPSVGRYGRRAVHIDFLEARLVQGDWKPPKAGDAINIPGNAPRKWVAASFDKNGVLRHIALRGGYVYAPVESPREQVLMLQTRGSNVIYLNGEPRTGDPYSSGLVRLPVLLRAGTNHLLAQCSRGSFSATFSQPKTGVFLETRDSTLPDLLADEAEPVLGSVILVNATKKTLQAGLQLKTVCPGKEPTFSPVPPLPPLSTRKIAFRISWRVPEGSDVKQVPCEIQLISPGEKASTKILHRLEIKLRLRRSNQLHKRTFVSQIDGSVQYYAVLPAQSENGEKKPDHPPALFLTLHGAGVHAPGQARAYSPKSWGHIVAATNRRPFGFDWEDWGRIDAMEVLEDAQRRLKTDPRRAYLTGHSMGGHGVWHLGATFPDRFAAIGPSAGWISFYTYGARRRQTANAVEQMLARSSLGSDTPKLFRNYAHHGVYILHGSRDDNVPVSQARAMRKALAAFHSDFSYYEKPGAGHWWNGPMSRGTDCVDWPPMFEFFRRHTIPETKNVRHVAFATANPGVSARSHWATIEAQTKQGQISSVDLHYDAKHRRFHGTTKNVARLSFNVRHLSPGKLTIELDGAKFTDVAPGADQRVWLSHETKWSLLAGPPSAKLKGPNRYGPFKEAFRNRMVFVYGTCGTAEENAWALVKARYDAEVFWYRGNGSVDVIADTSFDATARPDSNVILYGNSDTNAAWITLLKQSPVQVRRGVVTVGDRELRGKDLACFFIQPRPKSDRALVAVVCGAGPIGQRAALRTRYFVSGVGYPDLLIYSADMLTHGARSVRATGFFGNDWSVERGEIVWTAEK